MYKAKKIRMGVVECNMTAEDWELFHSHTEPSRQAAIALNEAVVQASRTCRTEAEFLDAVGHTQFVLRDLGAEDSEINWALEAIARAVYRES